jgi:hypothetical protein
LYKDFNALSLSHCIAAFSENIIFFQASSTLITLTLKSSQTRQFKCSNILSALAPSTLG